MAEIERCGWARHPLEIDYHDREWGVPLHDDRALFELLILEGAQAGLNWLTVLKKRDAYREAFDNFEIGRVARYNRRKIEKLLADERLIRNRAKIEAATGNARAVQAVQAEFGSLDRYLWSFVGGRPVRNRWRSWKECPATSPDSVAMSKDLKKRGFRFAGPTICYAFMQAAGLVNDHVLGCFRRAGLDSETA